MQSVRITLLILTLATMTGCAGSVTGQEAGIGINHFDTISKEQQENEAWFDEFYGRPKQQ